MTTKRNSQHFDALIVGAGFGGIYQLYSLLNLGLQVRVIDTASDVGGTWFWNRYPGAMSDTESYVYRYSWDKDDLRTYPWSHHYLKQPEILRYLEHVVQRHDLRKHMRFNIEMQSADWDDSVRLWIVQTSDGEFRVKYLITALGLLSRPNYPDIPGINTFLGTLCHTAAWDSSIKLRDKRVGVIGCGSTGVQVITEIAQHVKQLVCFQRHPQYSVPSGNGPVSPHYRAEVNANYDEIVIQVRNSQFGFGFVESERPYESYPPEEREQLFQEMWDKGNGFRFMAGAFNDVGTNKIANEAACEFIRSKIRQIVADPEKARKLQPRDYYARRPLCDGGYYQQFNRDNVSIVDLKEAPISRITEAGIVTNTLHELDVIIFATGFDAIDGNYNRLAIRGTNGSTLKSRWQDGPKSFLGVSVPEFPNMFMITGPQSPFCNIPPAIEVHVEFITQAIKRAEAESAAGVQAVIEATPQAEADWNGVCEKAVEGSLFRETNSWIFGGNIPGKPHALRFYFGVLLNFQDELKNVVGGGYLGYKPFI